MKKRSGVKILIALIVIAIVCGVIAFFIFNNGDNSNDHVCEFNQRTITEEYKFSNATCEQSAKYFFSCTCGKKGEQTFYVGTFLGHAYGDFTSNGNNTHSKVCANDNTHVITENCRGGEPTCSKKAVCEVCGVEYGELKAHEYAEWRYTESAHWKECVCSAKTTESNHNFVNKVCECGFRQPDPEHVHNHKALKFNANTHWYECDCGDKISIEKHKGGRATCTQKAVCEECNQEYGELKPHEYSQLKFDEQNHWNECECGQKQTPENHRGGTATCTKQAKCQVCLTEYGDKKPHEYKNEQKDANQHWNECECGAFETKENHIPSASATENTAQVCTVCGYVITPALGHVHSLHLQVVPESNASCTSSGNYEYYVCSCGKWYWDNKATQEITDKTQVIKEKLPHEHNALRYDTTKHWYECDCGDVANEELHKGGTATCTVKAVCEVCGQSYGNVKPHDYSKLEHDATSHWSECVCGDKINLENHKGGTATCTKQAVCEVCATEYGQLKEHDHKLIKYNQTEHWHECVCGDKTTAENHKGGTATCTVKAVCSVCNQSYGELKSHEYDQLKYDEQTHWNECKCGQRQPAENHKGGTATCTVKAVCSVCSQSYGELKSHEYDQLKYDEQTHWYECKCGQRQPAENHKGGTATCKNLAICSICGQTYGSLAGHSYEDGKCKWCGLEYYSQGLEYILINNDTEYEVRVGTCTDTNVVIPAYYQNKPVTEVWGFANCGFIKSVKLPETIKYIRETAFSHCTALETINIPNGVQKIYDQAFWNCTSLLEITVPASVEKIYYEAFLNCTALKNVTLPTIIDLGNSVFMNCSSLETIIMPEQLRYDKYVTSELFSGCAMLKNVTIPSNVEEIRGNAFYGCSSLKEIALPNTLKRIEASAFENCHYIKSLTIPEKVTFIGQRAFANMYYLEQINYNATNCADIYFASASEISKVPFALDTANIGEVKTLKIANNVERIPAYLFAGVKGVNANKKFPLKSVEISSSVTTIGNSAFSYCSILEQIIIPISVVTMSENVFLACDKLTIYCEATAKPSGWHDNWNPDNRPVIWSEPPESQGLTYTLINYDTEYEVTGMGDCTDTVLVIPSTYKDKPVTSIGASAFNGKTTITNVFIPSSVTNIRENAFKGCSALQSVSLGQNSSLENVDSGAFDNCNYVLYTKYRNVQYVNVNGNPYYILQSVVDKTNTGYTIKEECEYICGQAFVGCSSLEKVTIPSGIKGIGAKAFYNCRAIKTVTFDENSNLKVIGKEAFNDCSNLTSIAIPDSTTKVEDFAFFSCDKLSTVTFGENSNLTAIGNSAFASCPFYNIVIPNKVTRIGNAFYNCSNLSSVQLPKSLTLIGGGAFNGSSKIVTVNYLGTIDDWAQIVFETNTSNPLYYSGNLVINGATVTSVDLSTATRVSSFAFCNYTNLTGVDIAKTVGVIGESAFDGCSNLTRVTFESNSNLTHIADKAFQSCKKLTSITLPNSVTVIGNYAFNSCSLLATVNLSTQTQTIGDYAFSNCSTITSITIPTQVESIGKNAFFMCSSLNSVTFGKKSKLETISDNAFVSTNLPRIIIPINVTEMGMRVFEECDSLTIYCEVESKPFSWADNWNPDNRLVIWGYIQASDGLSYTLINGGTEYEVSAYGVCKDTEVVVPKAYLGKPVTSIGKEAFKSCTNVTSIVLPNTITNIGEYAFYKCSALTTLVIPNSVTNIDLHAFRNCTSLQYNVKDGLNYLGNSANEYYCLVGPVSTTITSAVVDANCKMIGPRAFNSCTALLSVNLPEGLEIIGASAFEGCRAITNMEIPNSVTKIDKSAFTNCPSLPRTEKNGLMYLGNSTNKYLYLVPYNTNKTSTSVAIDENCKFIGDSAFYGWTALSSVTIPNSVIGIGSSAFYGCTSLVSVEFSNNLLRIGRDAFHNCKKLTDITLPNTLIEIGGYAFCWCDALTSIEIPDSVIKIQTGAFYDSGIKSATIGKGTILIDVAAFASCDGLASITVDENNVAYKSIDGNLYSKDGKTLYQYAIGNKLSSFTVPGSVTTIAQSAFERAYKVSVIIPKSVTTIEGMAFYGGSEVKIYCRATSKPSGWDNSWNYSSWPTYWGYTG